MYMGISGNSSIDNNPSYLAINMEKIIYMENIDGEKWNLVFDCGGEAKSVEIGPFEKGLEIYNDLLNNFEKKI
jgi:hypothetical protein